MKKFFVILLFFSINSAEQKVKVEQKVNLRSNRFAHSSLYRMINNVQWKSEFGPEYIPAVINDLVCQYVDYWEKYDDSVFFDADIQGLSLIGNTCVAISTSNGFRIYNAATNKFITSVDGDFLSVLSLPGNRLLAIRNRDDMVMININNSKIIHALKSTAYLQDHEYRVSAYILEGKLIVVHPDNIIIYSLVNDRIDKRYRPPHGIKSCLCDNKLILINPSTVKKNKLILTIIDHKFQIKVAGQIDHDKTFLHRDGATKLNEIRSLCAISKNQIALGFRNGTIKIFNIESMQFEKELKGHEGTVSCLCVLPSNKLASGSSDHSIRIWDINSEKCIQEFLEAHSRTVTALCLLRDGSLVSGSNDGHVLIWRNSALYSKSRYATI